MYSFSFLLPTRGRPDLVRRFFESILDTTHALEGIEIVLCLDDDDLNSQSIYDERLSVKKVILPRGSSMGALNRACFEASSGRYVILINDDVIIRTTKWDRIITDVFSSFQDDIALIHVNDLLFRENLCTFPILSRKACLEIGICPEEYRKYRIDDHIYDIYQLLAFLGHRRIVYLDGVVFEHDNKVRFQQTPSSQQFKSEEREISLSNKEIIESDTKLFNDKLDERKQNALTLARIIDQNAIERKLFLYKAMLNTIIDPYSYRRKEFVKRIESNEMDSMMESSALNIAVIIPNIHGKNLKKCASILKRYTPNSELIILNENDPSLIKLIRGEGLWYQQKSVSDLFITRTLTWFCSNRYTQKIVIRIIKLFNEIGKHYYNLPYPVRKVTDRLLYKLIKQYRSIQYRDIKNQ